MTVPQIPSRSPASQDSPARPRWVRAGLLAGGFVALLWLLEIIDAASGHQLDRLGIRPRTGEGLVGVLLAPMIHFGWGHLESNTVPTLVLGFLVLAANIARGLAATAVVWLVGGLGVWLLAPGNTITAGASVLVFGWLVYLLVRGLFNRRVGQILLGVVLLLLYGGLLLGVLPGHPGVSWQGHLFGAIGGVLAAWLLADDDRADRADRARE